MPAPTPPQLLIPDDLKKLVALLRELGCQLNDLRHGVVPQIVRRLHGANDRTTAILPVRAFLAELPPEVRTVQDLHLHLKLHGGYQVSPRLDWDRIRTILET